MWQAFVETALWRKENFDVIEIPESLPNLLGQVPLEVLDLVVDSKRRKLVPNPAHGREQMTEEYWAVREERLSSSEPKAGTSCVGFARVVDSPKAAP